jgi:hypothetical protein
VATESELVKRLGDLIAASTPKIRRSQNGLTVTLNGTTNEIAFSTEGKTVSKIILNSK